MFEKVNSGKASTQTHNLGHYQFKNGSVLSSHVLIPKELMRLNFHYNLRLH
jgi:hypothetical protein